MKKTIYIAPHAECIYVAEGCTILAGSNTYREQGSVTAGAGAGTTDDAEFINLAKHDGWTAVGHHRSVWEDD
jgi:hypothetical protein